MAFYAILLTLVSVLLFHSCQGNQCPISVPQDVSRNSLCYKEREESLAKQHITYGIREPTPKMPYSRFDISIREFKGFLAKEPFLRFQAGMWIKIANVTRMLVDAYVAKTVNMPSVMTLPEYAQLMHFREALEPYFDGYVVLPSKTDPFQSDMTKWITDEQFAEQRLAGVNPMTIQRVTFSTRVGMNWDDLNKKLNPRFDLSKAVRRALGKSLEYAIYWGYLFVLYQPLSDNIRSQKDLTNDDPHRRMWDYKSPISLYLSVPGKYYFSQPRFMSLAIQMDSKPEAQVYTPDDGDLWMLAKLNVQNSDMESSQIIEHLSKVHFVTEALCLSVERQLSARHPLHAIMKYHCLGVLILNTVGGPVLLAPHFSLDKLFEYRYIGSNELIRRYAKIMNWNDLEFTNNIKKRGLDARRHLPYYPYRDDGKVVLKVIREMITDYVDLYYRSNDDVRKDSELQNYVNEISAEGSGENGGKGNLRGFPAKIHTKRHLVDTFTQIIWTMSAQHSAISYPMADYSTYVPNMPMKIYDDDRVPNNTFSGARLPNREQTVNQLSLAMALAEFRYDRLFDYGEYLDDPNARQILYRYLSVLTEEVEPLLDSRNIKRLRDGHLTYPYLSPRWLPNGVQS